MSEGLRESAPVLPSQLKALDRHISRAVEQRVHDLHENSSLLSEEALAQIAGNAGDHGQIADAVDRLDEQSSQSAVLETLLDETRQFAPRAAFFLTRPDEVRGWAGVGFEEDEGLGTLRLSYDDDTLSTLRRAHQAVSLDSDACRRFASHLGAPAAARGLLIPFVIGGHLSGSLYADDGEDDNAFDEGALRLLTRSAAHSVESLAFTAANPATTEASAEDDTSSVDAEASDPAGGWAGAAAAAATAAAAAAALAPPASSAPAAAIEIPADDVLTDDAATAPDFDLATDEPDSAPDFGLATDEPATAPDFDLATDEPDSAPDFGLATDEPATAPDLGPATDEAATAPDLGSLAAAAIEEAQASGAIERPEPEPLTGFELDSISEPEADLAAIELGQDEPPPTLELQRPSLVQPHAEEFDGVDTARIDSSETPLEAPLDQGTVRLDMAALEQASREEDPLPTPEPKLDDTRPTERAAEPPTVELGDLHEPITETIARPNDLGIAEDATLVGGRSSSFTPPATPPEPIETEKPAPSTESLSPDATSSRVRSTSEVKPPDDVDGPGSAFREVVEQGNPDIPAGEEGLHNDARRLARLLVSEIRLYNEELIEEGRREGNIYGRLREDIDRSRQMYDERVDARVRETEDYFHTELVQRLAGGDRSILGI